FFSRSDLSMKRLPTVDDFARNYGKKLNVVVIGCETKDKIQSVMDGKGYAFAVAVDNEHKTFTAYGAQFVPYGVLLDARGKVLWFGNSSKFGAEELKKTLEWE
ncbi:MAG: redoxin domain-containing protein, partial [Rikenellaceae bacterium]|nr:redoxin domain-containing protein [Rikenellaceae bacterium]